MTSSDVAADQEWVNLLHSSPQERAVQMRSRYEALAAISEEERRRQLLAMARAEYSLPDGPLREFTRSRLRAWLDMGLNEARVVASSYDEVMKQMPGPQAMRRIGIVQTLAREMPTEEVERLRALVPRVFADRPIQVSAASPATPSPFRVQPKSAKKRPRWAFWSRS